ncbi:MAG: AAA family ATPase, partial [Candidatus Omnitrophota bacterium]|nr:AAA family ATPase [Candidatus Omnitrophota bacterium]
MYKRTLTTIISKRLQEPRRFVQVITGPRQVGKTTAIQQVLEALSMPSHYAAADLPAPPATEWIAQQWELARMHGNAGAPAVLVLDEVQRVSHWSIEVKRLWDEDTRLKRR